MLSIILVAVDFSGCSEAAFRVARALARNYQARLIVLHVPTPPPFVTLRQAVCPVLVCKEPLQELSP